MQEETSHQIFTFKVAATDRCSVALAILNMVIRKKISNPLTTSFSFLTKWFQEFPILEALVYLLIALITPRTVYKLLLLTKGISLTQHFLVLRTQCGRMCVLAPWCSSGRGESVCAQYRLPCCTSLDAPLTSVFYRGRKGENALQKNQDAPGHAYSTVKKKKNSALQLSTSAVKCKAYIYWAVPSSGAVFQYCINLAMVAT